jgi:uncharacterized protein (TIGR00730 family)
MQMRRLCVFCGSSSGNDPRYAQAARELGKLLVARRVGLVFGAGHIGLMGVIADAVLEAGGEAIGVIPQVLVDKELAHRSLTDLRIVPGMHERKAAMAALAHAFVALPGGYGTADEWFEMLTWAQLRLHDKPIGVLNVNGFFDPLLAWLDRAVDDGFVKPAHRRLLVVAKTPEQLLDSLFESEVA